DSSRTRPSDRSRAPPPASTTAAPPVPPAAVPGCAVPSGRARQSRWPGRRSQDRGERMVIVPLRTTGRAEVATVETPIVEVPAVQPRLAPAQHRVDARRLHVGELRDAADRHQAEGHVLAQETALEIRHP